MTAVDTNVLDRVLTGDDPRQASAAKSIMVSGPIWIAKTVLLETAWVLRSYYGYGEAALRVALAGLLGWDGATFEDQAAVVSAFALTEHGVSLADALHLCSRPAGGRFPSFDEKLVQRAKRAGADLVVAVP